MNMVVAPYRLLSYHGFTVIKKMIVHVYFFFQENHFQQQKHQAKTQVLSIFTHRWALVSSCTGVRSVVTPVVHRQR